MNGTSLSSSMMYFIRGLIGAAAGMAFNGKRDYYKVFGWNVNPTHENFLAKYVKQDIAQRVIDAPVKGTWTDQPILDGGKAFNTAWKNLVDEYDLFHYVTKADIFAGLGAFSIMIVGIDDGLKLSQPVNARRDNRLTYLQPYLEGSVEVTEFDENPNSKRFGKPVMYKVKPGNSILDRRVVDAKLRARTEFYVHWSRILHLADNTLENSVFGHSRLESVYNTLDDILKVGGGSAETYWLTANRGMQVDVDKDMELDGVDAENLAEEIEEYEHGMRRILRTRGVKVSNLGSNVADPKNTFGVLMALLSANTGIPQRVLMGAEAGQLASQQDRANWSVTLDQRIKLFAEPIVLKPLVRMLVTMRVLPAPKNLLITWPEPFKMNPLERAQTAAQQARSATNLARTYETMQKVDAEFISLEEGRQIVAPGDKVLIMDQNAKGTFPPRLSAPYNEPKNKQQQLDPLVDGNPADVTERKQIPPNKDKQTSQ